MAKRPLTNADLLKHLAEQLGFLEDSSRAFDAGRDGEAKRLAVTLRVLLHDTPRSSSLLTQLGRKGTPFWDLCAPDMPGNLLSYHGQIGLKIGTAGAEYFALLDGVSRTRKIPFDQWWTAAVFRDQGGATLSRRDLVLTAADQDGGAHVDPALDERYARFALDNALGWTFTDGHSSRPMEGATRASIRQIAHEVLRTLVPHYPPRHGYPVGGASVARAGSAPQPSAPVASSEGVLIPEVERNDPCPCGSGRKYKKCHGANR